VKLRDKDRKMGWKFTLDAALKELWVCIELAEENK
jgi:hypothetical protein